MKVCSILINFHLVSFKIKPNAYYFAKKSIFQNEKNPIGILSFEDSFKILLHINEIKNKDDVLTFLVHTGYLGFY